MEELAYVIQFCLAMVFGLAIGMAIYYIVGCILIEFNDDYY